MAKLTPHEQSIVDESIQRRQDAANQPPVDMSPVDITGTPWEVILKDCKEVDPQLTPAQLEAKYGAEHPIFLVKEWEEAKQDGDTTNPYWEWVAFWLEEDIAEHHLQSRLLQERNKK